MDRFTTAYIACALWSTNDESTPQGGEPLYRHFSIEDLPSQTIAAMQADCDKFRDDAKIVACIGDRVEQAGHDFWLTRNHHGAGFWEKMDWPEPDGDYLDIRATSFGECDLYVGDDGKVHVS